MAGEAENKPQRIVVLKCMRLYHAQAQNNRQSESRDIGVYHIASSSEPAGGIAGLSSTLSPNV